MSVARSAAETAMRHFDTDVNVEWKDDSSPVTVADREAEEVLRNTLLGVFPDDGFVGEESGSTPGTSGYRWIVDPIDGTRGFVRGVPIWGTLVGLEYRHEQIAGIVEAPALGQSWRALRGDGAYRGDRPIRVSDVSRLDEASLYYSSISWFARAGKQEQFLELASRTQRQRGFGDFYGFVLVAQGSGDLMLEYGVHPWDVAALKVIVEEAGGRFTDWEGTPTINSSDVIASNGRLHEQALRIMRG
jgi:histidinol-phosphatase